MIDLSHSENQVQCVSSFKDLVAIPYAGVVNALCWERELEGDFSEIVEKVEMDGNITELDKNLLQSLSLSPQGELARDILLADMKLLTENGASPVLNVIEYYDRDDAFPLFPTDVYSFHVDRSPIPSYTYLCTYYGAPSDIVPNSQAIQKVRIPELRNELRKFYQGTEEGFEEFLVENFFDLHYQANADARPLSLGHGHIWRLAIDHPDSPVPPCLHRAPKETDGQKRLLLIC